MKRIGVLTGGGDAPGLNAVIRAVVKTAIYGFGCEVIGIRDGYDGFIDDQGVVSLGIEQVRGLLPRGGTILGAANRGNPFELSVEEHGNPRVVAGRSSGPAPRGAAIPAMPGVAVGGTGR